MSEIEKYYNGEIHVDFEEDKPLLTKEEAEEYYNKLWLENKDLIQENIDKLNTKRFALEMELIDKDKEIERLNSIIKEVREYIENNSYKTEWGDLEQDNEDININEDLTEKEFIEGLIEILDKGE